MPFHIPTDLTIVTLRSEGKELPQRWTKFHAQSVLHGASAILRARADIEFRLGIVEAVIEEMPTGAQAHTVDETGYHFLAAAHRAGNGVRVLLADRLSRPDLGGQSRHQARVCLIAYSSNVDNAARILAHEFGHLLELPHIDHARRAGPGQEREAAVWARNLMNSGTLQPDAELNPAQIRQARSSALARRFGGP